MTARTWCPTSTTSAQGRAFSAVNARDTIMWDIGGVHQPSLPPERMVRDSPVTPLDVPLHPRAAAVWTEQGFLT